MYLLWYWRLNLRASFMLSKCFTIELYPKARSLTREYFRFLKLHREYYVLLHILPTFPWNSLFLHGFFSLSSMTHGADLKEPSGFSFILVTFKYIIFFLWRLPCTFNKAQEFTFTSFIMLFSRICVIFFKGVRKSCFKSRFCFHWSLWLPFIFAHEMVLYEWGLLIWVFNTLCK